MKAVRAVCLLLWFGIETVCAATLGGYLRWRPIPGSTTDVTLETSAVFDDATCGPSGGTSSWDNCPGCSRPWSSSEGTCIQTDSDKIWSINYAQETYLLSESTATPTLTQNGFDRGPPPSIVNRILSTEIDTRFRSDTGKVNSPPITVLRPVITVNSGCEREIPIFVRDEDGDNIECRLPTDTAHCGDFCTDSSHITLTESTCVITYNGGGVVTTGDIVVSMFIEDFPVSDITVGSDTVTTSTRLSRVSLQFVIRIEAGLADCTTLPVLADLSGGDSAVVNTGTVFSQNVVASATGSTVTKITAFGLNTVTSSSVTAVAGEADTYTADFTWTADAVYTGENTVCFTAELASGTESNQRCKTITVEEVTNVTTTATTAAAEDPTTAAVTTSEVNPCLTANGGCSDICNWSSGTPVTCSCTNACWHLARDGKNCIPEVQLLCEDGLAKISVDKCASSGIISVNDFDPINSPESIPSNCRPADNGTHTNFQYSLNLCGSSIVDSSTAIEYTNNVKFWTTDTGTTITRGTGYVVSVVCSFPKYNNLSSEFDPLDDFVNFLAVPGLGFFTFDFMFYFDETFGVVRGDTPVRYPLNSDIYFAIEATGGSGVELFTETCIAEPTAPVAEGSTPEQYTLIENGCLGDFTMRSYESTNPMHNRFSIKAFRFVDSLPGLTNDTNVAIKCYVVVCVIDSATTTRCSRGCVTSPVRRRRDVNYGKRLKRQTSSFNQTVEQEVFESTAHLVASVEVQLEKEKNENLLDWRWILLIIAAALGAALVLLACCRCCWIYPLGRRRRRKKEEDELENQDSGIDNGAFKVPKWYKIPIGH